jgi:hypothetical protein
MLLFVHASAAKLGCLYTRYTAQHALSLMMIWRWLFTQTRNKVVVFGAFSLVQGLLHHVVEKICISALGLSFLRR